MDILASLHGGGGFVSSCLSSAFVLSFFVLGWEPCNILVPLITIACFFSRLLVRLLRECVSLFCS